jgi:hypothetical protein
MPTIMGLPPVWVGCGLEDDRQQTLSQGKRILISLIAIHGLFCNKGTTSAGPQMQQNKRGL